MERSDNKGGVLGRQVAQEPKNLPLIVCVCLLWVGLIQHRSRRLPALHGILHGFFEAVQLFSDTRVVGLEPPSTGRQSRPS